MRYLPRDYQCLPPIQNAHYGVHALPPSIPPERRRPRHP
ncbi:unnamed protein product [Chondrus crispus]|uniref:Uncharacterized protein n=1 Tax=Chondrus crispus TaxID=2769 RepID=R7QS21_CHOCR|nr:unnamed protein product [Chondrus crispus]CDF41287.1 unnamed protein product [Chondrus crispus]|eukprot:XP_005711581.1 unnamed protein product [Chondrus crispus]